MRVRVTGIKQYRDRHGTWRRYYRRKGAPSVPISMDLKGQALAAEIARLDALYKPLAPVAGTLRVLISEYQAKSEHWKGLRTRTQKDYERVFEWLGKSQDFALVAITTPALVALRDKARDQHGFKFANQVITTLKMVYSFGRQYGHVKANPTEGIDAAKRPETLPEANRPWRPEEAVAILEGMPIHLRGPVAVAAYLGARLGDCIKVASTAHKDGLLSFTTSKTRRALELPVCDDLSAILGEYRVWRADLFAKANRVDNAVPLFVNTRGKPWTEDGFKTSFGKARDALLEAEKIGPGITFHGARHGVATILADAGFEEKVKHLLGHGAETMTEHYQRRAKRRGMLHDMTEAVQEAYRTARPNVIQLARVENESD